MLRDKKIQSIDPTKIIPFKALLETLRLIISH